MKVRKLAVALALAGGLGSGLAHGLGMGEGRMLSHLNEPLRAEIELNQPGDLSAEEIRVSLAPESDFERFGLQRMSGVLHRLNMEVVREDDGGFIVEVTTDEPIREPFLNMLVELSWPNGRLLREYSFLVDPPSRSPGPEAQGPQASASTREPGPERGPQPAEQRETAPKAGSSSSTDTQGTDDARGSRDEYGPTGATDTLWGIAGKVRAPEEATRQQIMLALQEANPQAFVNDNINQLKRGQVLRLPSGDEIRSRTVREAAREVMAQNRAYQQRRGQADRAVADAGAEEQSQGEGTGAPSTGGAQSGDDELRILVSDDESGQGEGDIAGMGDGEGDEKLASALEELERAERDRKELESRLKDLEDQIDTMSQLIELKDDQLAEMQQRLSEADEDAAIPDQEAAGETEAETDTASSGDRAEKDSAGETETAKEAADKKDQEDTDKAGVAAGADDGGPDPDAAQDPEPEGEPETGAEPATGDETVAEGADQGAPEGDDAAAPAGDTAGTDEKPATQGTTPPITEAPTTVGGFFDRLVRDPVYQIGAGVLGILLLLGLWALARRNAARERAFYEQLRQVSGDDDEEEVFDVDEGEQASAPDLTGEAAEEAIDQPGTGADEGDEDVIAEADFYMAYGRLEQATQRLEEAISSEPSRADLRLKLLEAYAGLGDSGNFEKQYGELRALGEDQALREADELRHKLEGASEDLSIDELAEQLKTGSAGETEDTIGEDADEEGTFDFSALDEAEDLLKEDSDSAQDTATDETAGDTSLSDDALEFDLEDEDQQEEEPAAGRAEEAGSGENDVSDLGFSMDDLELEESEAQQESTAQETSSTDDQEMDLDLELEDEGGIPTAEESPESEETSDAEEPLLDAADADTGEPLAEEEPEPLSEIDEALVENQPQEPDTGEAEPSEEASASSEPTSGASSESADAGGAFDDSFLEELDAELDRVTEEESPDFDEDVPTAEEPQATGAAQPDEADQASGDDVETGADEGPGETAESEDSGTSDASEPAGDVDDLELDVSEDDLALMDEFAGDEASGSASGDAGSEAAGDEGETAVGDSDEEPLGPDFDEGSTGDALSDEEIAALEGEAPATGAGSGSEAESQSSDQDEGAAAASPTGADGAAEGDEDDEFDFLEGTDEAGTKLDLARAYVEMGDAEGARDILEEVAKEGSDEQQQEAQRLLNEL